MAALKRARVTVAGLGGTGGVAALQLALSGIGRLHCVDADARVELSNLNRQVLYREDDIGRRKAAAAVHRLREHNSTITVTGEQARIAGIDDARGLARGCDVLVLAADDPPELRRWVNRACAAEGTPWVDAGYHGPLPQAGVFVPGRGACWECVADAADQYRTEVLGAGPAGPAVRRIASAQAAAAPTAGISGSLAAHYATALITGIPRIEASEVIYVNLMDLAASYTTRDPARPRCPGCQPAPAVAAG